MREDLLEILGGGLRIAQVKLHDRSFAEQRADGQGAALGIEADDVANQEVPLAVDVALLAHHHADEERVSKQLLIAARQPVMELLQHLEWRATLESGDGGFLGAGGENRLPPPPAALCGHRIPTNAPRHRPT